MTVAEMRDALAQFHGEKEVLVRYIGIDEDPQLFETLEVKRTLDPDTAEDIIVIVT